MRKFTVFRSYMEELRQFSVSYSKIMCNLAVENHKQLLFKDGKA